MGKNLIKITGFRIKNETTLKKLDIIAKKMNRDRNKQVNEILEEYVKKYEAEHGEIEI